jgi:hypothetical protein
MRYRTGAAYGRKGYWEKLLRIDDDPRRVVQYVLENPVRANLAKTAGDYPFLGSDVWSLADIL